MDEKYVKFILNGLKSSSSARIQETLLRIKNKIIINDSGVKIFRECGGLEYLLPHLRKPNEKILDITLSILGNCCLEEESSLVVGQSYIFAALVTILKTVCRDRIICRTCRVIGNLAIKSVHAEGLHGYGAVPALITVIESRNKNTSYATLTMAVRAIRQLWMVTEKRMEMLKINAVRCIAILLTTECEAALIKSNDPHKEPEGLETLNKGQEELITGILKCIGQFTTHATMQCGEQIQGDGRGYQCLVSLTKFFESFALKSLMNLCYLSTCRPLLGTAGFVECLVRILQNTADVSSWPEGAARALAHLSSESGNRARLRHCGGLALLITAAQANLHCLHALLQYYFDEISFKILLKEGLVDMLTKELINYLSTMGYEHDFKDDSNELGLIVEKCKETLHTCRKSGTDLGNVKATDSLESRGNKIEDEVKVIIERDNMVVRFVDTPNSEASEESQSEDEKTVNKKKSLKRPRPKSFEFFKETSKWIKMTNKDWSAGVYWEPKSPEDPLLAQPSGSRSVKSPEFCPLSPYSDGNQSGFSPEYRGLSNNRAKWDWSPENDGDCASMSPYWTEYQWSPSSSRSPSSPFSVNENSSDSEVSGRYSPVCSETEAEPSETKNITITELDTVQVVQDLDGLIMEDEDSFEKEDTADGYEGKQESRNPKSSRIACITVLLFRVTHGNCRSFVPHDEPVANHALELLTGKDCLNALLDYLERCKKPSGRIMHVLTRVLSNHNCLKNLLRHRVTLRLHKMSIDSKHPPTKCYQCKQVISIGKNSLKELTAIAESSYGFGEISYQLLKGTASMKQTLSLTLPYITRTEKFLKTYFIDYDGLNLLLTLMTESKEELKDCVSALAKLSVNVHIKDPKKLENRYKDSITVSYDPILDNLSNDEVVTFVLDDASMVKANRIFLCQNSDVFNAMLQGRFKESVETCVRLRNITKPALEYLLTLLQCGLNNPKSKAELFPLADELEINLEVLLLADRYLFGTLKNSLSSAILQFQLTPETAVKIYIWSLTDGMGFLCVETVAYLLVGKMNENNRTSSFKSILDLKYSEQWLDDVKSMILRHLVK